MKHIYKCQSCHNYSMLEKCSCGSVCVVPKPPKYSPEDKYAKYRRETKRPDLEKQGLL
ncbi:ribosome biogenesis protein [archaeon]|jgi:H/ACA ribonucleoprotein complex subunit 3|nr:ribosome biogenesis protein [archaeon]MBT4352325.1 ribosome biogenesis protein [archaeon]MBT4648496.1 ribosome biogenesis protein [archaeon]MBT6821606.1 ribosome biogenesis protein [archaeon]MBT7392494.1 ribosome biogenesis protein [archaeon]